MDRRSLVLVSACGLALAGCKDGTDSFSGTPRTVAVFQPSASRVPVPTNLLFNGTEDLTLAIPVADPLDLSDPQVALGKLDGWSTTAAFTVSFSRPLDASTLVQESTVRLFEVTLDTMVAPVGGPVSGVVGELTADDYAVGLSPVDPTGSTLQITPLAPLEPSTSYLLVLTDGIQDSDGRPTRPDGEYELVSSTAPLPPGHPFATLQGLTLAMRQAAAGQGIAPESIVLTNVFTTQSIGATLGTLASILSVGPAAEQAVIDALCASGAVVCADTMPAITQPSAATDPMAGTTADFVPGSPGLADVYTGELTLPYFLTAASNTSATDPTNDPAPLVEYWRARYPFAVPGGDTERNLTGVNLLPEMTGTETVPMLVLVPNGGQPKPWPVVIFVHGITRSRSDVLLVADTLCGAGFAVVAIDQPLHGITDPLDPLFTSFLEGGRRERTFGLDLVENTSGAPGPDGIPDPSGQHFINLTNLLASRDNLRQSEVDLMSLRAVLGTLDVDGGGADLDAGDVSLVGHSLGGMVGTVWARYQAVTAAVLNVPGGGVAQLLRGSETYGPVVDAGLASVGVLPGTPDYAAFFFAAQTVVDPGDPINHGAALAASGTPILMTEVIGGGPLGGMPDAVIPNTVAGAPLSGTEPLAEVMGLTDVLGDDAGAPLSGIVRFLDGYHGSLIDPLTVPAAYVEMQGQTASFLASDGTLVDVTDDTLILTTAP